jgi:hypothetical protein
MYWVLPQCTVKYEEGIQVKEEQVIKSIIDKIIENIRCFGTRPVVYWSAFLTTNHEVPGSILGSTMGIFP